jgi:hypothetical protein
MNAKELAGSISRFVGQIKPTNNPSDDAVIKGFPEWFIEDLENSATILRQQADRIAELEKLVSDMAYEKASGVYDRPQTKHEPVAWVSAYQLAKYWENEAVVMSKTTANMLRQQADRIAELEKGEEVAGRFYWESVVDGHVMAVPSEGTPHYNKDDFPLYTTPQIKELSDDELNKAFDYYCETDEGVLRFNYELRDEWKKEQLIRWKEAFKKASEK